MGGTSDFSWRNDTLDEFLRRHIHQQRYREVLRAQQHAWLHPQPQTPTVDLTPDEWTEA